MRIVGTIEEIEGARKLLKSSGMTIEYVIQDLKVCKICGHTSATLEEIDKHYYRMATGKLGYMAMCKDCYNDKRMRKG